MKILHIISSSGMYGAEAVILNLARTLATGPHTCALAVFDNASNPNRQLYDAALREGLETHLLPCAGQFDRSTLAAIRAVAAATGADLVHAHGYKADIYCFLALRRTATPLVSTCHTWYDTDRVVTLYGKLDRFVLRSFARVVAVSEEVRQRLLAARVPDARIRIVRNGIDLRPFASATPSLRPDPQSCHPERAQRVEGPAVQNCPPDPQICHPERAERVEGPAVASPASLLVGLIGRLAWEKGVDIYLAAAALVLAELPTARFVVVGEGPDRAALEAQLDTLNLRPAVTFLGRRDDMPAVYASLDLMVSASRQEGLPIALLEGAASGLPIVATSVGEVPTVVRDGATGFIVPPGDPAALATAILTLLRSPDLRARFSAAARQLIAAEFSADRMAADYLAVYAEALATKSPAGRGASR